MSALAQALETIYQSLHNNNQDIDTHIAGLKNVMSAEGLASVAVDPTKLPNANRQGRKMMQSYFRQRGVAVTFPEKS